VQEGCVGSAYLAIASLSNLYYRSVPSQHTDTQALVTMYDCLGT